MTRCHVVGTDQSCLATTLVESALARSLPHDLVVRTPFNEFRNNVGKRDVLCFVGLDPATVSAAMDIGVEKSCKIIVFGDLPEVISTQEQAKAYTTLEQLQDKAISLPAKPGRPKQSDLFIRYRKGVFDLDGRAWSRPFCRYDFGDEWNNLGYGKVTADGSIWSICSTKSFRNEQTLASVHALHITPFPFSVIFNYRSTPVFWVNRQVGLIDSPDWKVVESFISDHGASEFACLPVIDEIPAGYDFAFTMRLDCDEDIASAAHLFAVYREMNVPFSLAIKTSLNMSAIEQSLIRDILAHGGSIQSHSHSHHENWGGSEKAAFYEASKSKEILDKLFGINVTDAVAPFHHLPDYALAALERAGFEAVVAGTVNRHPEMILARPGRPLREYNIISHTQQCMLHGDCVAPPNGDVIFSTAVKLASLARRWFGVLDHPFSERYQYAWKTEEQREASHRKLLGEVARQGKIFYSNEADCLAFLKVRSKITAKTLRQGNNLREALPRGMKIGYRLAAIDRVL